MPETKTRQTEASAEACLAAIDDPQRRGDCMALAALMARVTGEPPRMWGTSIVGFGSYHYRYASGHQGDACLAGFSARKGDVSVYVLAGFEGQADLLARLGKHKVGKACLYLRRLSDIDIAVLEELIRRSVDEIRRRHP